LAEASAAEHGGELWGLGQHRNEVNQPPPVLQAGDVEAEEAGRVEVAEAAEEGGVRGVAEPALGDGGGADEAGGEAEAEEDLAQEVVVAEHRLGRGRGCRRRTRGGLRPLHSSLHCGHAAQIREEEQGFGGVLERKHGFRGILEQLSESGIEELGFKLRALDGLRWVLNQFWEATGMCPLHLSFHCRDAWPDRRGGILEGEEGLVWKTGGFLTSFGGKKGKWRGG
jgi:hypothetical protein